MNPLGFGIIKSPHKITNRRAHAMNKSITQDNPNDNHISKTIRRFFTRFHISSALKLSNTYKKKGIPVIEVFLPAIYKQNKKRRGRSRYLLSVIVEVIKDGKTIPAKVVYVRNKNKRNEYLCLISTDITLDEDEIISIYGKRWDIEVFFKFCKSYLKLSKECNSLSYDAMTAHVAIVFTRYRMLSIENRESQDERSLGELFLYFSDEMSDIT